MCIRYFYEMLRISIQTGISLVLVNCLCPELSMFASRDVSKKASVVDICEKKVVKYEFVVTSHNLIMFKTDQ
jgi:hypothetical protein